MGGRGRAAPHNQENPSRPGTTCLPPPVPSLLLSLTAPRRQRVKKGRGGERGRGEGESGSFTASMRRRITPVPTSSGAWGPLPSPYSFDVPVQVDPYSEGLTPAKKKRPRHQHRGRWFCPRCSLLSTESNSAQKCPRCLFTFHQVCAYCDRAYARRTLPTHTAACRSRYLRYAGTNAVDPNEIVTYASLEWVDYQ